MKLGKNQMVVLRVLRERKGAQTAGDIHGTAMTPETAAATLRGLEKRTWVRRSGSGEKYGGPISTWGTRWEITSSGITVLKHWENAEPEPARLPEADLTRKFLGAYSRGVKAIWEAGQVLLQAKEGLSHGQFTQWVEEALPIAPRTAQKIMRIGADPNITRMLNNQSVPGLPLPDDKNTLAEICGLEEGEFNGLLEAGTIHPEMRRGDLRAALAAKDHPDEAPPLPAPPAEGRYRVILADPPWQFRGGQSRSADRHYPTMPLQDIEMLPVLELAADDAVIFLWVTSDMLHHAPRIMIQWGFEYKTVAFVWVKPPPYGLGYWTRKNTEICLLGTRGKPKRKDASVSDLIMAPRGAHSDKPDQVRADIERLVGGPYIELFARNARPGWDAWGNDPSL